MAVAPFFFLKRRSARVSRTIFACRAVERASAVRETVRVAAGGTIARACRASLAFAQVATLGGAASARLEDAGDELPRECGHRVHPEPELEVPLDNLAPVGDEVALVVVKGRSRRQHDVRPEADVDEVADRVEGDPRGRVQRGEEGHAQRHPEGCVVQKELERELEAKVARAVLRRRNEPVVLPQPGLDDVLRALGLEPRQRVGVTTVG